jgi:signal transduction histidine kinase
VSFVFKNKACLAFFLCFQASILNAQSQIEYLKTAEKTAIIAAVDFKKLQSEDFQTLIERTENAENQLLTQKRNFQIYGWLGVGLILSLIGFTFFNQKQMLAFQILKEQELKTALANIDRQNKLQEQRLRMSKDLNEGIAAQLTTIISSIDSLKYVVDIDDKKLSHRLRTLADFTATTFHDFKDTIWAMSTEQITLKDIRLRILNYADRVGVYTSNIRFLFHIHNDLNTDMKFTALEGLNLIRAIELSINNCIAHANPTVIKVQISKVLNHTLFKILDNGKGFDLASVKKGNGFNTMEKNMEAIGGDLKIITSFSKGTEIILIV